MQEFIAARDPLRRNMRADCCGDFAVLGIKVRFETNSPAILDSCSNAFGRNGSPVSGPPQFTVRLLEDPSLKQTPPWPEPLFRGQRNLFYVCIGAENTAVADLDRGQAMGFLAPAMVQDNECLRRTFVECLTLTMATHGKAATHSYVHASAVAIGNKGLILSGPAHAGKSTLAYACARRGFHVVSDDAVYLRIGTGGETAWGNPWRLRLAPDSLNLFVELKERFKALDRAHDSEVMEFDTGEISPTCPKPCCEPAALFFLDRCAGPCSYRRLDPAEAVKLLARDLIQDSPEVMRTHCRTWLEFAARGSYLLRYGEDLESVVRTLEHFLSTRQTDG